MHAFARQIATPCLRQLAKKTTGSRAVSGEVSGMLLEGHNSLASKDMESPAVQPASLWQQLLTAGKPSTKGTEQKSKKQQGTSIGSASGPPSKKSAGPKLKSQPGRSAAAVQAGPGKAGTTDLGQGSVIIYSPALFPLRESLALYQSLQVSADL